MSATECRSCFSISNVVLFVFTDDPRSIVAERLFAQGVDPSVQALNEFTNVARRELGFDWDQVEEALHAIGVLVRTIHPLDLETRSAELALAQRYGFRSTML